MKQTQEVTNGAAGERPELDDVECAKSVSTSMDTVPNAGAHRRAERDGGERPASIVDRLQREVNALRKVADAAAELCFEAKNVDMAFASVRSRHVRALREQLAALPDMDDDAEEQPPPLQDLRISAASSESGPCVDGATLVLRAPLAAHLGSRRIFTARGLLAALRAFPGSFLTFGWSVVDVQNFTLQLIEVLNGVLPDAVLRPPERSWVGYGANDTAAINPCVPAPGGRRCLEHMLPLYPSGRCVEGMR